MRNRPANLPSPMARAVICDLKDGAYRPKTADAASQPLRHGILSVGDFAGKAPRHYSKNRERDRNEPDVNLKYLAHQQWHAREFLPPIEQADQEQVQHGNSEL